MKPRKGYRAMEKTGGFHKDFPEKMQALLDGMVKEKVCVGASILVGRFGKLAMRCDSGWANREKKDPIGDQTLFQMFSLTKPVTAVAVMQLWDKGCFQLSDPVSKYLPAFADMVVCHTREDGTEELRPATKPITIHDLLTMTSGITYSGTGYIGDALEKLSQGIIQSRTTDKPWNTLDYVNRLAKVPLRFEPSTEYLYSLGFDVLGALVEACSGKRLDKYCRDHIFAPLGMQSATYFLKEAQGRKLAGTYTRNAAGELIPEPLTGTPTINAYTQNNASYVSGGSGLICTAADYFQFAKMLANKGKTDTGEVLLSEEALQLMSTPQLTDTQLRSFPLEGDTCLHAAGYSYGYGVHIMRKSGNHLPVGEWGWAGTMGTWMSIDPQNELLWVYAHQVTPATFEAHVPQLSKLIYDSLV